MDSLPHATAEVVAAVQRGVGELLDRIWPQVPAKLSHMRARGGKNVRKHLQKAAPLVIQAIDDGGQKLAKTRCGATRAGSHDPWLLLPQPCSLALFAPRPRRLRGSCVSVALSPCAVVFEPQHCAARGGGGRPSGDNGDVIIIIIITIIVSSSIVQQHQPLPTAASKYIRFVRP